MIGKPLDKEKIRFKYRTVGIAIKDNHVLIHKAEENPYWSLPGGHVEMMETTKDALLREIEEEIGVRAKIDRLVWTSENFFERRKKLIHEVAFYYLISFPDNPEWYDFNGRWEGFEEGSSSCLYFCWYDLNQLENITLYPSFLKEKLKAIPSTIEHIVFQI